MAMVAIVLMVLAMAVTLGILATGILAMARGGAFNDKWGNRLMRYRLLAQAVALLMFLLGVYLLRSGA